MMSFHNFRRFHSRIVFKVIFNTSSFLCFRLYSIIASTLDMKEFVKSIEDLQKGFKDKNLDCQHGIIVTLGFSLAKKNLVEKSEEDTVIFWEILR